MKRPSTIVAVATVGVVAAAADAALLFGPAVLGASGGNAASAPIGSSGEAGGSGASSSGAGASSQEGGASSSATSSSGSSQPGGSSAASGAYADGSYTGAVVSTAKGDVQVSVTVSGGRITDVVALRYPDDNDRSVSISKSAIPKLISEAVDAQGAEIQLVSGATETSTGFVGSLQDALNQAS